MHRAASVVLLVVALALTGCKGDPGGDQTAAANAKATADAIIERANATASALEKAARAASLTANPTATTPPSPTDTARPTDTPVPTAPPPTSTPTPTPAPSATPSPPPANDVADLQKATVQIIVRGDDGTQIGGSGSVVGAEGLILTNAHVLYNYAAKGLYDTDGKATIAITTDPHRPAKPAYIARLVQLDPKVDLAVLKVASARGGRALPRGFKLRDVFRLADSNAVQIGDQLRVFGFPGVGGNSVTFTRGVVSGFLPYEDMSLIKTDAQFTHGSSGGAAVNDLGELVGVPTAGIADEAGRVGYLVPINSARPLIRKAAAGQRIALGPLKPAPAPTATPTPAPITLPTPTSEPSPGVATETLYVEAASQGYKGAAVRERPSPKSRQLAFLANGTSVQAMPDQIVGEDGEYWYEVVYQGRRAYVLAILLTVSPP